MSAKPVSIKHENPAICPECGRANDVTTTLGENEGEPQSPLPGDLMVCFYCAAAMQVAEPGYPAVRAMPPDEETKLHPETRDRFEHFRRAIRFKTDIESCFLGTNDPAVAERMAGGGATILGVDRPSQAPRKWRPLREHTCAACERRVFVSKAAPSWARVLCTGCAAAAMEREMKARKRGPAGPRS